METNYTEYSIGDKVKLECDRGNWKTNFPKGTVGIVQEYLDEHKCYFRLDIDGDFLWVWFSEVSKA